MLIASFSNYLNHHQIPLANAFNRIKGVEYVFVATTPFNKKRLSMGYKDENKQYDFVLRAYEGKKELEQAHYLTKDADIVLIGSAPDVFMTKRLSLNKITFRTCERYFRKGFNFQHYPRYFARALRHLFPFQNYPLYFLCMSAYTSYDINLFTKFQNRAFKWAYFTENRDLDYDFITPKKGNKILWCGRLLELKHPDAAIRVALNLKKDKIPFQMDIIGDGEMKETLVSLIQQNNLSNCINLLGFLPPNEVRKRMEESDIFLFTSDYKEGWGAVLNEAMSSGCAVVSSHACGSTPFLVRDNVNGLIYESGNENQLFIKTKRLLTDPELRKRLSFNAFMDMRELWDAHVAAERLPVLYDGIKAGCYLSLFQDGPCSPAQILKNNWYHEC